MAVTLSYDTVTTASILKAINTPGGPARDYVEDLSHKVLRSARRLTLKRVGSGSGTGTDHPGNAATRGGKVGVYLASWYIIRQGPGVPSNQYYITREVGNAADHAVFVENGKRKTNKIQAFSWVNGRQLKFVKGTNQKRYTLGQPLAAGKIVPYRRTLFRAKKNIMRDATYNIARSQGLPFDATDYY